MHEYNNICDFQHDVIYFGMTTISLIISMDIWLSFGVVNKTLVQQQSSNCGYSHMTKKNYNSVLSMPRTLFSYKTPPALDDNTKQEGWYVHET